MTFLFTDMEGLSIIITAGGLGKRMGADVPKQFLLLSGRPILMRTLERMHGFTPKAQFIITLPEECKEEWNQLCTKHNCAIKHEVISGGKERFDSVKNALEHCRGNSVMIHDGVRPLVSKDCFERALDSLKSNVASIPCLTITESMRRVEGERNYPVNRDEYLIIQTPQCFRLKELKEAYEQNYSPQFTDDASVMEASSHTINLFEGNPENVKITQVKDIQLAEFYHRGL